MSGPDAESWLREVRAARPGGEADPTPACLDDEAVAALADGTCEAERRTAALSHVAACARCRAAVASVARALADPDVAREIRVVEPARRRVVRPSWLAAAGVAAAAVLVLMAWPPARELPRPHRAAPITAAPAPQAIWPVGVVPEVNSLRWTPVPGADRYRVSVYRANGVVRYEAELAGTEIVLPDSARPAAGETGWWQVDARVGFDRWAESALIEFTVGARP